MAYLDQPAKGDRVELKETDADAPLTEQELADWEARARQNGTWSGAEVLRLIAEIRRRSTSTADALITRDPGRCGGAPTIAGSRIGVHHIVALAAEYGWNLEALQVREFPDLSLQELQAAVTFYRAHQEQIDGILHRDREFLSQLPPAPMGPKGRP